MGTARLTCTRPGLQYFPHSHCKSQLSCPAAPPECEITETRQACSNVRTALSIKGTDTSVSERWVHGQSPSSGWRDVALGSCPSGAWFTAGEEQEEEKKKRLIILGMSVEEAPSLTKTLPWAMHESTLQLLPFIPMRSYRILDLRFPINQNQGAVQRDGRAPTAGILRQWPRY